MAFCSHGVNLLRQGGLPRAEQRATPLEVAPGQRKAHANSNRSHTCLSSLHSVMDNMVLLSGKVQVLEQTMQSLWKKIAQGRKFKITG